MNGITIRLIAKSDLEGFLGLLDEFNPRIAGLRSRLAYKAVFEDSLGTDNVLIIVAEHEGRLVGFTYTVIDWKRYKRRFIVRHPFVAFVAIYRRVGDKLAALRAARRDAAKDPEVKNGYWIESSPEIAHVFYTGVSADFRRRGIASSIARFRLDLLKKRGIKRVDTMLHPR